MKVYKLTVDFVQNKEAGDLSALRELMQLTFLRNEHAFLLDIKIEQVD